jgi:hypothetical protein
MSAFTPLRSLPSNPITTQEHHSEQTSSVVFDPRRGTHFIPLLKDGDVIAGSVAISEKTHFKPVKTTNVQYRSPDMFEPPAIKRTKRDAPMMPNL